MSVRALATGLAGRAVLAERDEAERDEAVRAVWELVASPRADDFEALVREVGAAEPSRRWWEAFLARAAADPSPPLVAARALLERRYRWGGLPTGGLRALRPLAPRIAVRPDAFEAIAEFAGDPGAAFFVDPPYSIGGQGPGRRLYRHHKVDHDRLLGLLAAVRGRVLVTYDDRPEVRSLAARHGFEAEPLSIRDGHRRRFA